ncbi:hypothetical protein Bca52824_023083 [Brassica carinata]|uniref:20 kDa chaperonin, chloroplastic n=1 Tax=Brassica carinata TaxID=52824 RepID=A0A8X7VI09_BRACI|nr:hypothetical protein Bca52824_023083 [Brassica carinata]
MAARVESWIYDGEDVYGSLFTVYEENYSQSQDLYNEIYGSPIYDVYDDEAGTEVEFNDVKHLILKEDDIVRLLKTEDIKDLKPLNDRVFIKVNPSCACFTEEKTAGGLFLTKTTKEKPSIGTVVAVEPGTLDEEGKRQPLLISAGSTVLYSKYAGNDFKGKDGSNYIGFRCDGYPFLKSKDPSKKKER